MLNVKKTSNFLIAFILLLSCFISCESLQKESKQTEKLQIDFYIRYLQSDKQVKAEISFSEMDSIKKIIPKRMKEVLFQGQALDGQKILNQYRYTMTKENDFPENYKLSYRSNGQEIHEQLISINPIADFTIKKNKISKKIGTTITFDDQLKANEELVILISDENNRTSTIKIKELSSDFMVKILPEQVANLNLGKGSVYIVRKQLIEKEEANHLLKGRTEFYTAVKELEIID